MSLAISGYSEEYLLKELRKPSRTVWYEYTIQDNHSKTIGTLSVDNASISFDSSSAVMRTLKGTARKNDLINIDTIDSRIVPWLCLLLSSGDVVKWPLGRFLIDVEENGSNGVNTVSFAGYDLGKIAYDDAIVSRLYVQTGTTYTSIVSQILGEIYNDVDITVSTATKNADQEWEVGKKKLEVVNDLLQAINYNKIHFDEFGKCIATPYKLPQLRSVELQYKSDDTSVILDGVNKTSDKFDIPNKFIRYVENVDASYYISVYENDSSESPYSTVNRGRVIVDCKAVSDIATQADLDGYVRRCAMEALQRTDSISFTTLNMPGHGFRNCMYVNIPIYGIDDKYIESRWEMELKVGGRMRHICEKVVSI